ncbi:energy transducer TonB [Mesorhizobium hawassense]|uniref:Energy transducer TonB n=2 Tax=Mesorhizobium hawassense TaxID=1209954 RepID=A0A330HX95_9HYPH|nr:energy transducer TonB [Mesorhizobium hawassense]
MQETGPLPDSDSDLAIAPAKPLAETQPSAGNGKWSAAIIVSCLLHAGLAAGFLISPKGMFDFRDTAQPEGSDQAGDMVAGTALEPEPQATNVTLVPDPQPPRPTPPRPAPPPHPPQPAAQIAVVPKPPVEQPKPTREQVTPPVPEPQTQASGTPDILVSEAARDDDRSVAAETGKPAQPVVEPEIPKTSAIAGAPPPIPSQRPTPPAAAASETGDKRGTADGQEQLADTASKGKKQKEAGSDAEYNYRGDVYAKLGKVNRTLPPSLQLAARNNAVVAFVVGTKGNVDALRILESSGSAVFDKAALGMVRKAAPFPPIPPQAASPSFEFEINIGPF